VRKPLCPARGALAMRGAALGKVPFLLNASTRKTIALLAGQRGLRAFLLAGAAHYASLTDNHYFNLQQPHYSR